MSTASTYGAVLSIDLDAICDNWLHIQSRVGRAHCAAVVKADAYGLGASNVGPALAHAGCRHFFVAHWFEALALRPLLPQDATIFVLHGPPMGKEVPAAVPGVVPVLNSVPQIQVWRQWASSLGCVLPAIVQVDSGMSRLGLSPQELLAVASDPDAWSGIRVLYVMSHLACAEHTQHPFNQVQHGRFVAACLKLPLAPQSLANSSGVFLGPDYHFDLVRPGAALYGIAPVVGAPNPMKPVVRLQGRVLQLRDTEPGDSVGYGMTWKASKASRIATVCVGYADGWLRSLGNSGSAWFNGIELPMVGNVSMDTMGLDVSSLPASALHSGDLVDLINDQQGVDAVASRAGTIAYEILTCLGQRYERRYISGGVTVSPAS